MDYLDMAIYLSIGGATLIIAALYLAFDTKRPYTLKSLFIPRFEGEKGGEIAVMLLHPLFWIVSFGIVTLFIVSLIMGAGDLLLAYEWIAFAFALIIFMAIFDPLVIWFLEGKYREPLRFVTGSLMFGMIAALASFLVNTLSSVWFNEVFSQQLGLIVTLSIAPFIEEIMKMVGVVALAMHRGFKGPLDGILVGFSIGAGFALVENLFYIITKIPGDSIDLLVFRAVYNTIAHGSFTAIGGAILGKIKMDFGRFSLLLVAIPVFTASLVHIAFNILAIVDIIAVSSLVMNYYVFSPLLTISLAVIVLYLIYFSKKRRDEKEKNNPA